MSNCIIIAEQFVSDLQNKINNTVNELESKGLRVHATQPVVFGQFLTVFIWYFPLNKGAKQ